jgi:hypothetical protein
MWSIVAGLIRNSFMDMHTKESRIAIISMVELRRG